MAWPIIDWDALLRTDMNTAIASLHTSFDERRQKAIDFSVIEEPSETFDFILASTKFRKQDGVVTTNPTETDAVQPFNKPAVSGGGWINYNLYNMNNNIRLLGGFGLGGSVVSILTQRDSDVFPPVNGYGYAFTKTLGGSNWVSGELASLLSLSADFFDLKDNDNVNTMEAKRWSDMKNYMNELVFVSQYPIVNNTQGAKIQDIDLRPFLTDQT